MVETVSPPLFPSKAAKTTQPGTTAATADATKAAADATEQAPARKISSDFETFLRMLTVQMQNQDPLNPVDSTDYATQLATFSSVEQQVLTNDLLTEMSALLGGGAAGPSLESVSGWIGMEGLSTASVKFAGEPVAIRGDYAPGADSAKLVVRNATGEDIQSFDVDIAQQELIWGGADSSGAMLPGGTYSFHIESYKNYEKIATTQAPTYRRIDEVRDNNGVLKLRLSDGTSVASESISGLRAPRV